MPTYDYDCVNCHNTVEVKHRMSEIPIICCDVCGSRLKKRIVGLQSFPGSSWRKETSESADVQQDGLNMATTTHPESLSGERDRTLVIQENTRLADNVDADKLLIEIVQGILMAHGRLDDMEDALRQAVEAASLEHLKLFDKSLREIDVRFQQTTVEADKAVESLRDVHSDLVGSVQGASERHLDAFTKQLRDVDHRFQTTAGQVAGTVQRLVEVRDELVNSVQAANQHHNQVFSGQVDALHKNIDCLREEAVTKLHNYIRDNRYIEKSRYEELAAQGKALKENITSLEPIISPLASWQFEFSKKTELFETKQTENWKNLNLSLKDWQAKNDRAFKDIAKEIQTSTSLAADKLDASLTEKTKQQAEANRRLLIWLICLSATCIVCLGAIVYKVFFH